MIATIKIPNWNKSLYVTMAPSFLEGIKNPSGWRANRLPHWQAPCISIGKISLLVKPNKTDNNAQILVYPTHQKNQILILN